MFNKIISNISKALMVASVVATFGISLVSVPALAQGVQTQQAPTTQTGAPATGNTNGRTPNVCQGSCPLFGNITTAGVAKGIGSKEGLSNFILNIAKFLTFLAASVAVVFMVYGGYKWMDVSDAKGAETGKTVVTNAAIGLAVAILAYTIVALVGGALQGNLLGGLVGNTSGQ